MMIDNPKFAPARPDLTFLRKRTKPKQAAAPPPRKVVPAAPRTPARPAQSAAAGGRIDYTRPDRTGPESTPAPVPASPSAPRPAAASAPDTSSSGTIDYTRRDGRGGSLDPSTPTPPTTPRSDSLDLSGAQSAPAPQRAAARAATPSVEESRAWQQRHVTRIGGAGQLVMSMREPTACLTRVQSGIGQLQVEAVCSPQIGDLRLGAAYQLRSGGAGIVQLAGGNRFGPSSRRPVITASREEYERLGIDLRQTADIERIAVYAFSESRQDLTWGGTLVVTLFGGARLEVPLETLYVGRIAMLTTFYNMDGELVVRTELETIAGDVREATRAYGFDRITWRDEKSPVD